MSSDGQQDVHETNSSSSGEVAPAHEFENDGERFRLRMSKDRMRILVDCDVGGNDLNSTAEELLNRLRKFGVRRPPNLYQVRTWLMDQSREDVQIRGKSIAEGIAPRPPVDGHVQWGGDFFNPGFVVDETTGRVNFRKHAAERNVKAGQLLATVIAPIPGKNGIDVTGEVIRVRKPRTARIRVGQNVRADEATATYYSTTDGRFRFSHDILAVDDLYEIGGDVGLETGDVSHPGAVVVHGDILEGARVEAQGDVEVDGIIDGAHVQVGGLLRVHGGITGREHSRVIATGGIRAKYILDAHVQSGGDVVIEKEVMHSTIVTRGALFVPEGRVVGGRVVALGGVDAGQIGSAGSAPTEVVAGEDYALEGRIAILRKQIAQKEENVQKVRDTIARIRGKVASLPEKSRDAIRRLLENLPAMEKSLADAHEELDAIRAESRAKARHIILTRRLLYPESRLSIWGATLRIREEVPGPVRTKMVEKKVRLAATRMRSITGARPEEEPDAPSGASVPPS